ncbi:MAG TPA: PH domain-containing protein [Candidatus Acidoferrales bacterium]|nr:PH domain-containing protein [Candidatus Acidoferrales bacterium]
MGYIERNLLPGEKVMYKTRLHWSVLIGSVALALLFAGAGVALLVGGGPAMSGPQFKSIQMDAAYAFFFLSACFLGYGVLKRNATEMSVTNRRLVIKTGMLSRRTIELLLGKVESIQVQESFMGRMVGYGTIIVHGTGGTPESFHRIAHPLEFRRQMEQQVEGRDK